MKRDSFRELGAFVRVLIPYLVGVIIYSICLSGSQRTFPGTWFYQVGPGPNPPWYFIGSDLVSAEWCAAGAAVFIAFIAASARKLGALAWTALGIMLISFADPIGRGVNILLHTRNVWDRQTAVSDWPTFDAYLASQNTASQISMGIMIVVVGVLIVRYFREIKKQL